MLNLDKLKDAISLYKDDFLNIWKDEKFKWEAVKHFQDNWNINSPDFLEMISAATLPSKTKSLLTSMNNYPRGMIVEFAKADAEATRAMFIDLFDESKNLVERIDKFQTAAEDMRVKYDDGNWKNHYQGINAISTYLWLRYPDKYYIYKYSEARAIAKALDSDYIPKKGGSAVNAIKEFEVYDENCDVISKDEELISIFNSVCDDSCYKDPKYKTLTIDVAFFISRNIAA